MILAALLLVAGVLLAVSLLLFGFLWTRPRYYLLEGGNDSVVINGEGHNWTINQPIYFGDIGHLGKFAASLVGVGLCVGGLIAYRVRQGRAARKLVAGYWFVPAEWEFLPGWREWPLEGRGLVAGNLPRCGSFCWWSD